MIQSDKGASFGDDSGGNWLLTLMSSVPAGGILRSAGLRITNYDLEI
ncbi:MAG: hypothetical protein JXB60_07435 [Candidatus Cloacimonetes bacterium]|nr:hypothetical protein [Candidatus Cloacimonadota bacterium]